MQYHISINQKCLQEHFPELDIIDAAIYDFIRQFMASDKIERLQQGDQTWYWISYKKILDEMPILGIKSKDAVYRRVRRLAEAGIFKFHPGNAKMSRSYIKQGPNFDLPVFSKPPPRTENRGAPGYKTDAPPDEKPRDHNTSNHNTNNQKERESPLTKNFLNVQKMDEPLTIEQGNALTTRYGVGEVNDILRKMDNYKPLRKKNISAYQTAINWLERERAYTSNNKNKKGLGKYVMTYEEMLARMHRDNITQEAFEMTDETDSKGRKKWVLK